MKNTLSGTQTALRASSDLSYIDDESIYISPNEAIFFIDKDFPQIVICDGNIHDNIEEGDAWERDFQTKIVIYQELKEGDDSLMGSLDPLVYGVLDIAKDIHKVLFDNFFGLDVIEIAIPDGESDTDFLIAEDIPLLKKVLYYKYQKLESNP